MTTLKRFVAKVIELALIAVGFIGLFWLGRIGVDTWLTVDESTRSFALFLVGLASFAIAWIGGAVASIPIRRRLLGKQQGNTSTRSLRGNEKPHGVTEDRSSFPID